MSLPIRLAYPFADFAKGRGIARCGSIVAVIAIVVSASSAQLLPCGIRRLPAIATKIYPPIAEAAHVNGTVVLLAAFDHEGVPSVTKMVGGPELLKAAAIHLIEASRSEPSTGSRECPVVVEFKLIYGADICEIPPDPETPYALIDPQHLTVFGRTYAICDPAMTITKKRFLLF